jgi:ribonucleotide monophosphatase NagD (HAD superfamily)
MTGARGAAPGYHGRMRVRGLLVDLDGTLYVGDEPVEGAARPLAGSGLPASPFVM